MKKIILIRFGGWGRIELPWFVLFLDTPALQWVTRFLKNKHLTDFCLLT